MILLHLLWRFRLRFDPNDDIYNNGLFGGGGEAPSGSGGGGEQHQLVGDNKCVEAVMKEDDERQQQGQQSVSDDDEDDDNVVCENDDGVFVFWGDDDEDDDNDENIDDKPNQPTTTAAATPISHNQVQLDLSRAVSKNKPYIRYAFKCPSRKNEKALWLAAFSKVGRLSDESKRKKTLFGKSAVKNLSVTIVPTVQKNSRMRRTSSPNNKAADLARLASLGDDSDNGVVGVVGVVEVSSSSSAAVVVDETAALLSSQKEYRVRPNYAYQHRWMTHAELTEEMLAPSSVMHDTRLSPTVATSTTRRELGLMRVEVLQCRGLPQAKGKVNPNCVVYLVCGSYAFATDVIPQKVNPMWLRGMRRACALPVFHGYAVLMVGVFHDDGSKGSSAKDTFFGRVEVPIARLRSNNTYDVTLPLRESTSVYSREKLGAIRLRFSFDYQDQRQFILSYAPSMRNKIGNRVCTTVACADPKSFRNIALTVHGTHLPDQFSTDVFKAAIRELTFVQAVSLRFGKKYVRDLMYWKYPIFSAYCFGGWMHCVYCNSVNFVPVYLVGFALLHLAASYVYHVSNEREDVRPLTWDELLVSLQTTEGRSTKGALVDGRGDSPVLRALGPNIEHENKASTEFPFSSFAGYSRFCVDESLNTSRLISESEWKGDGFNCDEMDDADDDLDDAMGDDVYGSLDESEKPLPEQNVSVKKKKDKDKSIKRELEEVEEKVQKATKYLFQYHTYHATESNGPPFQKKAIAEKGSEVYDSKPDLDKILGVGQFSQWNPIVSKVTSQFIPITRILGVALSIHRSFYSIVTWRDPILTFWVSIAGMISIAVLIMFPWRLAYFITGIVFFGPQNWVYRIFKEHFLDDTKNRRPGRIVRAFREILKDDDGNGVWDKSGRVDEKVQGNTSAVYQPLFRCHAPVGNPLVERTNNVGAQHIAVPYSALFFSRFSDWPPDPDHTRVFCGSLSFNASLCPSSSNDVVPAPKLAVAKKADVSTPIEPNREMISTQVDSAKVLTMPSKPQHTQKEIENSADRSQPVNVKTFSSVAKTMGNRVAAKMSAKLQPTLSKYKQANKIGVAETANSKYSDSAQSSSAKVADEDTFDDGIPSVIETVTTNNTGQKNDHDSQSQQNSDVGSSLKDNIDDQPWNESDQAGGTESSQLIGEEYKGDSLSKIDENQDLDATDALHLGHCSTVEEMGDKSRNNSVEDAALLGASASGHYNEDSDGEMDELRLSPSSDSTNLLQQLLAIKLELATVRTENDNYKKKLEETEEERDLYKEKLEHIQSRVGFLANTPLLNAKSPLLNTKGKSTLFGKKKTQTDAP